MHVLSTKSLYCMRKWIGNAGLAMLIIVLTNIVFIDGASAASAAKRSMPPILSLLLAEQPIIQSIVTVSTGIAPYNGSSPNITVGENRFQDQ